MTEEREGMHTVEEQTTSEGTPETLAGEAEETLARAEEGTAEAAVDTDAEVEAAEAEGEASEGEGEAEAEEEDEHLKRAKWYVIHCYSGMEYKVKRNLETRIETMGVRDRVFSVIVPTEETIELRDGVRRRVERRVFPGYILVHMILEKEDGTIDEEVWHVVRHTPGVTGFVGIGTRPTPLSDEEVDAIMKRIESEEPQLKVDFRIGERVRITSGPFADFTGTVVEIYPDKGKARVAVSFFNRETPVEVDFLQLEKV